MRKLAVGLLSASVFSAQLTQFMASAQRNGNAVGQRRPITVSKSDNRQERRTAVPSSSQPQRHLAFQELASIIVEAQDLQNKTDAFKVLAKSANLLWLDSPTKSRLMFRQLWQLANEQLGESDEREEARTDILRYLARRDSKLAARLLEEASADSASPREVPFSQRIKGTDPTSQRLNNLASKLVQQQDNIQAANVLERALTVAVTPANLSTLTKLRQTSAGLTDAVVSRTLERMETRPTVVSLPGLYLLVDYVFPASNVDPNAATLNAPRQSLRVQYFSTSYNVLRKSLKESEALLSKEQGYSANDLRFRSMFQNHLAGVLETLAPKFAPELIPELRALATEQFAALPEEAAVMSRFTRLRLSDNEAGSGDRVTDIAVALTKGDLHEAEQLLSGVEDEKVRKAVAQAIAKVAFDLYLAKSELDYALSEARKLEDHGARAIAFAQLARVARAKRDTNFSKLVVAESLSFFSQIKSSGLQALALLMLAPEAAADSIDLLRRAVTIINDLPEVSTGDSGGFDSYNLDNSLSFKDAPELQRAFSTIASDDFEGTLAVARQIEPKLIGLLARLAALEPVLKETNNKTRLSETDKKQVRNSIELGPAFLQSGKGKPAGNSAIKFAHKTSPKPNQPSGCSCSPCMIKTSLSPPTPGPWWDCASQCLRTAGVSPIQVTACGATCVFGVVPLCAICFALNATAFLFCSTYCAAYAVPPPTPHYCPLLDRVGIGKEGVNTGGDIVPLLPDCSDYEDPCLCPPRSPIIIDVAGDGFELTNVANGVMFNITGFGREPIGWTQADSDDAFLALDLNANGMIDNGTELFGNFSFQPEPAPGAERNGFAALALFDYNADGKIDSSDTVYSQLRLWQDRNHNGVSEPEELQPAHKLGLKTLFLDYRRSKRVDKFGNEFRYRARVNDFGDRQLGRWAWDVFLVSTRPRGTSIGDPPGQQK
ncbi:MAG: hypothetical protein ND895_18370 [Pyrinomonadaceae bacterium]|nr:hypothetical protein [Pyrinomonadaceae bacterium]